MQPFKESETSINSGNLWAIIFPISYNFHPTRAPVKSGMEKSTNGRNVSPQSSEKPLSK